MNVTNEGVLEWVTRVAKVGSGLQESDFEVLMRVVEGTKTFMKSYASQFVLQRPGAPLLLQLSGDCTPVSLRS
eukprot:4510468-Amphidinium_carterae.1